jgi:hypothetical protein
MRENGWVPVRAQEQSIRTEARDALPEAKPFGGVDGQLFEEREPLSNHSLVVR